MAFVMLVKAAAFFLKCSVAGATTRSDEDLTGVARAGIGGEGDLLGEREDFLLIPARGPERTLPGFLSPNCIPIATPLGTVIFKLHTLSAALELRPPRLQLENNDVPLFSPPRCAFGDAYCAVRTHGGNMVDTYAHRVVRRAVHNEFVFSCLANQLKSLGYTNVPRHAVITKTETGDTYRWTFEEGDFGIQIEVFYDNCTVPAVPLRPYWVRLPQL